LNVAESGQLAGYAFSSRKFGMRRTELEAASAPSHAILDTLTCVDLLSPRRFKSSSQLFPLYAKGERIAV
jgi:hypothetical protein